MFIYLFFSLMTLSLITPSFGLTPILGFLFLLWLIILAKLASVSSHVLLVLLMLEFFMLVFLLLLLNLQNNLFSNSSFVLIFFTLAVCEASLGLGLLIAVSRKFGSQTLSSFLPFKLIKLTAFKAGFTIGKELFSMIITLNFQLMNLLNF